MNGIELAWFESYPSDRSQYCFVNGVLSDGDSVTHGAPQGSILGPLLILVYINDYPDTLSFCTPGMYANDTYITTAHSDIHEIERCLYNDLITTEEWLIANKLNFTKTKYVYDYWFKVQIKPA